MANQIEVKIKTKNVSIFAFFCDSINVASTYKSIFYFICFFKGELINL